MEWKHNVFIVKSTLVLFIVLSIIPPCHASHIDVEVYPYSSQNITGIIYNGSVDSLNNPNTGILLNETTGAPGIYQKLLWGNLPPELEDSLIIRLTGQYGDGSPTSCSAGHNVDGFLVNQSGGSNISIGSFPCNVPVNVTLTNIPPGTIINSTGYAEAFIYHPQAGVAAHKFNLTMATLFYYIPDIFSNPLLIDFLTDPADSCVFDNCLIHIRSANRSKKFSWVNITLEGVTLSLCNGETPCDYDLVERIEPINLGRHNITISSDLGNESIWVNFVNVTYYEFPYGLENMNETGDNMQIWIYLFFAAIAFVAIYKGMQEESPVISFAGALFFALTALNSVQVSEISGGVQYLYSYPAYFWLWGGLSILSILLTIFFILDDKGFSPPEEGSNVMGQFKP